MLVKTILCKYLFFHIFIEIGGILQQITMPMNSPNGTEKRLLFVKRLQDWFRVLELVHVLAVKH
ncbi:hypothetical protein KR52_11225 [Synechococcus sp. KORDI-52]|nr:hypothetical protein KR52_11225 [Synechococcus sp. KORDI-52]